MVNAVAERDVARAEIHDVHAERDEVICLAEAREVARIRTVFYSLFGWLVRIVVGSFM